MDCMYCQAGYHEDCLKPKESSCCCAIIAEVITSTSTYKDDEDIRDPHSTGRKRAAIYAPLTEGMLCEWRGLKFAGGGKYPIVGCLPFANNPAVARHHGPDKNTLKNEIGNLHRICVWCHNRWHARNDSVYAELFGTKEWLQHDGYTLATDEELVMSEARWVSKEPKGHDHD